MILPERTINIFTISWILDIHIKYSVAQRTEKYAKNSNDNNNLNQLTNIQIIIGL